MSMHVRMAVCSGVTLLDLKACICRLFLKDVMKLVIISVPKEENHRSKMNWICSFFIVYPVELLAVFSMFIYHLFSFNL